MKAVALAAVVMLGAAASAQEPVYKPGDQGVRAPQVTFEIKPQYTEEAMKARIQGNVELQTIVGVDGKPGEITVTKSLDSEYGLDASAVEALKKWRFRPGTKDGKAVPVQVSVEMTFKLRDHR